MKRIIRILYDERCSCVVESQGKVYTFNGRGVSDLYDMTRNRPGFLKGASIADKIIGKAAAALLVSGGAESVYAHVISLSALILLRKTGIEVDFGRLVPVIQNRTQTDWCPLERLCYEEKSAGNILSIIEGFIAGNEKQQIK